MDRNCKDPFNNLVGLLLSLKREEMNNRVNINKKGCCKRCNIF